MKKLYNTPIVEIIKFKAEDIIITSFIGDGDFVGSIPGMGWGNEEDGWPAM